MITSVATSPNWKNKTKVTRRSLQFPLLTYPQFSSVFSPQSCFSFVLSIHKDVMCKCNLMFLKCIFGSSDIFQYFEPGQQQTHPPTSSQVSNVLSTWLFSVPLQLPCSLSISKIRASPPTPLYLGFNSQFITHPTSSVNFARPNWKIEKWRYFWGVFNCQKFFSKKKICQISIFGFNK
jgi:hypothetical protein